MRDAAGVGATDRVGANCDDDVFGDNSVCVAATGDAGSAEPALGALPCLFIIAMTRSSRCSSATTCRLRSATSFESASLVCGSEYAGALSSPTKISNTTIARMCVPLFGTRYIESANRAQGETNCGYLGRSIEEADSNSVGEFRPLIRNIGSYLRMARHSMLRSTSRFTASKRRRLERRLSWSIHHGVGGRLQTVQVVVGVGLREAVRRQPAPWQRPDSESLPVA